MKRIASILFALAILLSSGLVQFVVHICPDEGAMWSAESCEMHEAKGKPDCCSENEDVAPVEDCCQNTYFFGVTPKFGQISPEKIVLPCALECLYPAQSVSDLPELNWSTRDSKRPPGKPPLFNRMVQQSYCTYII